MMLLLCQTQLIDEIYFSTSAAQHLFEIIQFGNLNLVLHCNNIQQGLQTGKDRCQTSPQFINYENVHCVYV